MKRFAMFRVIWTLEGDVVPFRPDNISKLERLVEFYDGTKNAGKVLRNLVYIKF